MHSLRELYKIGRGPSSSHTMGPERAAHDFLGRCPQAARFRAVLFGSLAHTGKGHLTDVAILSVLGEERTEVIFDRSPKTLPHPNTMTFYGLDEEGKVLMERTYLSVGGGIIRAVGEEEGEQKEVYPFRNFSEIKAYCEREGIGLDEAAYRFEDGEFRDFLREVWDTMRSTVEQGLRETGELPGGLHVVRKAKTLSMRQPNESPEEREKREICSYAFATAEENASCGLIVTAPTCGASGVLPAVLFHLQKKYNLSENAVLAALAAAGMVGNVVKHNASVSGAEAGCQAEIGTATCMAAAAVCRLYGYSLEETEYAAEIALEHQLGLTCDPVGGLVQIPCIERNAVAAMRALDAAELAHVLHGTRKISFDTIVKTMYETGKDLSERYRETSDRQDDVRNGERFERTLPRNERGRARRPLPRLLKKRRGTASVFRTK